MRPAPHVSSSTVLDSAPFERRSFYPELSGLLCSCAGAFCLVLLPLWSLQDEQSAMLMLKRHMILKQDVDDYADSIQKLSDRAQKMLAEEHPDGSVALTVYNYKDINIYLFYLFTYLYTVHIPIYIYILYI